MGRKETSIVLMNRGPRGSMPEYLTLSFALELSSASYSFTATSKKVFDQTHGEVKLLRPFNGLYLDTSCYYPGIERGVWGMQKPLFCFAAIIVLEANVR